MKETKEPTAAGLKCYHCQGRMRGTRQNYRYTECGLSSVVLVDIIVNHCSHCGAIVPEIKDADSVHFAIAFRLLKKNGVLIGEEIRFLRTMANYSATHLAKIMGVTKFALSRWENNKVSIGVESDRLLRFACLSGMGKLERPDLGNELDHALDLAKECKEMNLSEILAEMDVENGLQKEPQPIRLKPEDLALCGIADTNTYADRSGVIQ